MNQSAISISLLIVLNAAAARAGEMIRSEVPGEIVVSFDSQADRPNLDDVVAGWGLAAVNRDFVVQSSQLILKLHEPGRAAASHVALIRFPKSIASTAILNHLNTLAGVNWCAPNYLYTGDPRELTPNDPQYGSQYHHPLMKNNLAWDITLGTAGVIVAITDDGVELTHSDLAPNIWINTDEVPSNGVDDDGNGYIDDRNGWDIISNNNNPNPDTPGDTHGTHVAGIAAARTNNAIGVAGTAGGATIMAVQFYNTTGGSWTSTVVANAFIYAVNNGARIINTSYNIDGFVGDPTVTAAFQFLYDQGVLHFNSAGNNSALNPPRQAFHQTLLVANTNASDVKSSTSNYGTGVDLASPGSGILSTVVGNGYANNSGTSMASPNAAGVAALIWSAFPAWTRDQVAAQLYATTDNIDAQNPSYVGLLGSGRVNSHAALTTIPLPAPWVKQVVGIPPDGGTGTVSGNTFTLRFNQIMASSSVNNAAAFSLVNGGFDGVFGTGDDQASSLSWTNYRIGTNDVVFTIAGPALSAGRYRLRANAGILTNPFGTALDGNRDGTPGDSWTSTFVVCNGPSPANCPSCVADFSGNAIPDATDLSGFVVCAMNGNPNGPAGCGCADLNADGVINQVDVSMMADLLVEGPSGACCGPDGVCVEASALDCAAVAGGFQGTYTTCAGLICPQPCPCTTPITTFPYSQNFESEVQCSTTCPSTCNLLAGWTNVTDGSDDMNWSSDLGGTPSASTGPTIDANPGTATGKYLYTEASSCNNATALLVSPCFNIAGLNNPRFSFGYHMCGSNMGSLHVEVSTDNCLSWTTEFSLVGPQQATEGAPWLFGTVNLTGYSGSTALRIRIRGETGPGFTSDMAVDYMRVLGD